MEYLNILLQADYEALGIKSILISAIVGLSGAVAYLYVSKEKALEKKDEILMTIIREHKEDIKLVTKDHETDMKGWITDVQTFTSNYHVFMKQVTDLANGRSKL